MAGFFKGIFGRGSSHAPSNPLLLPLEFSDSEFVSYLVESLEHYDPQTRAMVLVAHVNLSIMLPVFATEAAKRGEEMGVREFIKLTAESVGNAKDDIARRKPTWFHLASLLKHGTDIARQRPELAQQLSSVWALIAADSIYLRSLLPNNIIWTDEEKEFFRPYYNDGENEFLSFAVNQHVPKFMSCMDPFLKLAESRGIFFSSGDYIGPFIVLKNREANP
ncbi:hypothetical protein FTO60_09140 [Octadecabacter sp. SW4]|uniref:hypothetical protein n=1 Tax=Octadecabacter sp. SW4 TaxID=2602067 RepID=UPI0011C1DAC1|nr:hypothetical protein [Octadecabacter sp. SW4]QEE35854.1 hypothetical protein FTO60_09140 [Octadecabacter sp. SW4]